MERDKVGAQGVISVASNVVPREVSQMVKAFASGRIAEAQKLADSGAYHDYTDIEYVLRFDYGLTDVSSLLDSQLMHRDLNRRCADARERLEAVSV